MLTSAACKCIQAAHFYLRVMIMNRKIEILAPAGSFESMVGAINAGADAVYMGGHKFGARAFANNPDEDRLMEAIDFVHLHNKKLYLTVNTLMKDKELENQLFDYLKPLYLHGLDAVIVQDMGAATAIRRWFPDLDIHASTQMTVVSKDHALSLKELGITRIVPARELNYEEITHLKEAFGGEIECFVHGALCYCYSGQCLLSSLLGGRSGNRGRCAQPCRLPYGLMENDKIINSNKENYILSPKDICTLDIIPQLIECGIDSFKIEGRMKKPEYAALVSHMYRKYVDLYERVGKEKYVVDENDKRALMDLYNRGGFTDGYYHTHNGRLMMSLSRPNHFGSLVGKVVKTDKTGVTIETSSELYASDVLLIEGCEDKDSITLKQGLKTQQKLVLKCNKKVSNGASVYRLRNQHLIDDVYDQFLDFSFDSDQKLASNNKNQENIYVSLTLYKDFPATMYLSVDGFETTVTGAVVEAAKNHPQTKESIAKQINKTGNTPFKIEKLDILMEDDIFIPMQALNQLRRDGLESLKQVILNSYRRLDNCCPDVSSEHKERVAQTSSALIKQTVLISELYMADAVLKAKEAGKTIERVYIENWLFTQKSLMEYVSKIQKAGIQCYLAFPHVFRESSNHKWKALAKSDVFQIFDGYLIRNIESLQFLKDIENQKPIISDASLYGMNQQAVDYYLSLGISKTTFPVELNSKELEHMDNHNSEMNVYGYQHVMLSAQCLRKTMKRCLLNRNLKETDLYLKDRYDVRFRVKTVCEHCYNIIYNSQPLVLYDQMDKIKRIAPDSVRYTFTCETPEQIFNVLTKENYMPDKKIGFTRGHFNRGVE